MQTTTAIMISGKSQPKNIPMKEPQTENHKSVKSGI